MKQILGILSMIRLDNKSLQSSLKVATACKCSLFWCNGSRMACEKQSSMSDLGAETITSKKIHNPRVSVQNGFFQGYMRDAHDESTCRNTGLSFGKVRISRGNIPREKWLALINTTD